MTPTLERSIEVAGGRRSDVQVVVLHAQACFARSSSSRVRNLRARGLHVIGTLAGGVRNDHA